MVVWETETDVFHLIRPSGTFPFKGKAFTESICTAGRCYVTMSRLFSCAAETGEYGICAAADTEKGNAEI